MFTTQLCATALAVAGLSAAAPHTKRWTCSSSDKSQCSLAALAEQSGKTYFGTAYQSFYFGESDSFGPILESEFNQYTPENEMKWEVIEPEQGVYNWTGSDLVSLLTCGHGRVLILLQIIAESKKTTSYVRGHNFCWDQQT